MMRRWIIIPLIFMACSSPVQQPVVMKCDTMADILLDTTMVYHRLLPCEKANTTMNVFLDSIVFDGSYEKTLYVESFTGSPISGKFMCLDARGDAYMVLVSSDDETYAIDVIDQRGGIYLGVDTVL